MSLIRVILHWTSPSVIVEARPEQFIFRCQERAEHLEPILWVRREGRQTTVIGVGANVALMQSAVRIDLFREDWRRRSENDRTELVAAFCRYGITRVSGGRITCPSVIVRGVETLPEDMRETVRGVLGSALDSAFAYEVRWDDTDV